MLREYKGKQVVMADTPTDMGLLELTARCEIALGKVVNVLREQLDAAGIPISEEAADVLKWHEQYFAERERYIRDPEFREAWLAAEREKNRSEDEDDDSDDDE